MPHEPRKLPPEVLDLGGDIGAVAIDGAMIEDVERNLPNLKRLVAAATEIGRDMKEKGASYGEVFGAMMVLVAPMNDRQDANALFFYCILRDVFGD